MNKKGTKLRDEIKKMAWYSINKKELEIKFVLLYRC